MKRDNLELSEAIRIVEEQNRDFIVKTYNYFFNFLSKDMK